MSLITVACRMLPTIEDDDVADLVELMATDLNERINQDEVKDGIQSETLTLEREAAQRTGMSLAFLRHERRHGRGPSHLRLRRAVRYRPCDIETWLNQCLVRAEPVAHSGNEPR